MSKYQRPILHNSKSPETSWRVALELIKKYWAKKAPERATYHLQGWRVRPLPCGPPGRPPMPIFSYIVCFDLKRIRKKLSGRSAAVSRRNLGRTNLGLRRSCSAWETSLWEGEIVTIVITIDPLIGRGSIFINIFTSTISSQTLVHLLYPIFVPKPQIGTCGLLVVLITPCSLCQLVYLVEDHMFRSYMHINTPLIMNMNMLCEQLRLFLRTWEKSCYKQSCEFGIPSIF